MTFTERTVVAVVALALIIGFGPASGIQAAGTDDLFGDGPFADDLFADDLFGDDLFGSEDDLFGSEDDLFGGDGLLTDVEESPGKSLTDELLGGRPLHIGGRYNVSYNGSWHWAGFGDGLLGDRLDSSVHVGGNVFADVRPNRDVRLFGKVRVDGSGPTEDLGRFRARTKLIELFGDFHYGNKVFFRAGKQTINWGVGYFFSPADIVNIGRIDPENPEADREGPVALRVNVPVRSDNYYLYAIGDSVGGETRIALAPKAEWVVGGTEYGFGAYYRADRAPRLMTTVSGSIGKATAVFGEAVVSYGSDKRFIVEDTAQPLGVRSAARDDELFAHGTVGLRHSWSDENDNYNISVAGQYLFDGEGYGREQLNHLLDTYPAGLFMLMGSGQIGPDDVAGKHKVALTVNWSEAFGTRLSPGLFWLGDLGLQSGMMSLSVGVRTWDKMQLSVGANRMYSGHMPDGFGADGSTDVFIRVGYGDSF